MAFGLSRRELNFGVMDGAIGSVSPVYEIFSVAGGRPMAELIEFQIRRHMPMFMDILKPGAREGQPIDASFLLEKRMYLPTPQAAGEELLEAKFLADASRKYELENSTLLKVREALLPALLSGRVRVPVVAEQVEAP